MTWRTLAGAVLAACLFGLAECPAAEQETGSKRAEPSIKYVPLDAPQGISQAVIVAGHPLVHTRQILPLDGEGKLVGADSIDQQIEQILDNLEAVLTGSGSGLDKLVRLNVYALAPEAVVRVGELLAKRLPDGVRPAFTSVLTPMTRRGVLVAVDAVATSAENGSSVLLRRTAAVAGDEQAADAAVLPRGGVAYLSGQPDVGGLTESAVTRAMAGLMKTMGYLKITPQQVVQLKVFVTPAEAAEVVLPELKKFFPDQILPPVVFVEWLAAMPVEIELIAALPEGGDSHAGLEYFNPPEVRPSPTFSKVALVRADRQIFISSVFAREKSRGEPQAKLVFEQLQGILSATGSDLRHMAKATYYVSDDDAARWVDRTRSAIYDPSRPPAASKLMVHGVGQAARTMSVDVIAVEVETK
jgi:enamine deaminase RidA (YjgF/YER057c/UK114 family)